MSLIERSIQASPIDPTLFDHFSSSESSSDGIVDDLIPCSSSPEDLPLHPPIETPLIPQSTSPRLWNYRHWAHQLPYLGENLSIEQTRAGGIQVMVGNRKLFIGSNGLTVEYNHQQFSFRPNEWPKELRDLYLVAQEEIEKWRGRVVRLSMENADFECSLMDSPLPPKTFLVEYKNSVLLKSIKVHNGCVYFETPARTVSLPVHVLEEDHAGKVSDAIAQVAPELTVIDINSLYEEFVQLRGMLLDEDKRLAQQRRTTRRESDDITTIDITLGAG